MKINKRIVLFILLLLLLDYHYTRFVKFRPGVVEMLQQLSHYYELYIYSQGLKEYVDEVIKIIDPDQYYYYYFNLNIVHYLVVELSQEKE